MFRDLMTTSEVLSYVLALCFQTLLCAVGTILNVTCLCAFLAAFTHTYYRKTSLVIYLVALSICNTIQLSLSVFVIILPATEQFIDDLEYPDEYVLLTRFNQNALSLAYPLLMAANYASIWVLTLICAQRYQAVCHPSSPWKRRLTVVKRSRLCVTLVCLTALLCNLPRYWELYGLGEHTLYKVVQEGVVYGFAVYGMPMLLLIWLNYHTKKIVRQHDEVALRPSAEHRTARMTVCVFVLFFLCTTLSASLRLIIILGGSALKQVDNFWLIDLSNLLMNANALSMPVVCFVFTRGFRDLFFVVRYPPTAKRLLNNPSPLQFRPPLTHTPFTKTVQ